MKTTGGGACERRGAAAKGGEGETGAAGRSQGDDSASRSSCSGEEHTAPGSKERGKDGGQADDVGKELERQPNGLLDSCSASGKSKEEGVGMRDDNIPELGDEKFLGSEEAAIRAGLWCDRLEKDPKQVPLEGYAEDKSGMISMEDIPQAVQEREYVSVRKSIPRCSEKDRKNVCEDTSKCAADGDERDTDAQQNGPSSDKEDGNSQYVKTKSGGDTSSYPHGDLIDARQRYVSSYPRGELIDARQRYVSSYSHGDLIDVRQRRSKGALGSVLEKSVRAKDNKDSGGSDDEKKHRRTAASEDAEKASQPCAVAKAENKEHATGNSNSPTQKHTSKQVPNPKRRVKVYRLNDDGNWDDCITGHVRCETRLSPDGKRKTLFLIVVSERSGAISLEYSVKGLNEAFYQLQGSTIITWTEESGGEFRNSGPSTPCEMALSFAEESGCKEVWDEIRRAQARSVASDSPLAQRRHVINQANVLSINGGPLFDDELEISSSAGINWRPGSGNLDESPYCEGSFGLASGALEMYSDTVLTASLSDYTVPEPECSQLGSLAGMFTNQSPLQIPAVRERAATEMMSKNYVGRLLEVFKRCEDSRDIISLHQLFIIFRGLFLMGSMSVLEVLLSDEHFLEVVNTLEYDPEYFSDPGDDEKAKARTRAQIPLRRYRDALEENPAFRSVVEINDKVTLGKIHQNYRIAFIKDVILARSIDDITYSVLQSLIQCNNVDIVKYFLADKTPLQSLFSQFRLHRKNSGRMQAKDVKSESNGPRGQKSSPNSLNVLLRFVVEFLSLSKYLQPEERNALHSTMGSLGILSVVQLSMRSPVSSTRFLGTQILLELAKWEYSLAVLRISMTQGFPEKGPQTQHKVSRFRAVTTESFREGDERRSKAPPQSDTDNQGLNPMNSRPDTSKKAPESKPDQSSSPGTKEGGQDVPRENATEGGTDSEQLEEFKDDGSRLLETLFDIVCNDKDSGVVLQSIDIIRRLSNPETMTSTSETTFEKEKFLNVLYSHFIPKLLGPLKRGLTDSRMQEEEACLSEGVSTVSQICDLLSYFITVHGYRIKYFILGEDVIATVLGYLKHSAGFVRLAALRVLRTTVGTRDDFYDRYIVRNQLLKPVVNLFVENNYKDNLINSAVLELISFCAHDRRRELLSDLVEKHGSALEPSTKYSSAFEKAKNCLKYIEYTESMRGSNRGHWVSGKRPRATVSSDEKSKMAADQDEDEDYFKDSDMTCALQDNHLEDVPSRRRSLMLRSAPFPRLSTTKREDESSACDNSEPNPLGAQSSCSERVSSSGAAKVLASETHNGKFSIDVKRDPRGSTESPFHPALPTGSAELGGRDSESTNDSRLASRRKSFYPSGPDDGQHVRSNSCAGDRGKQEASEKDTSSVKAPKATNVARDEETGVDARGVEATLKRRRLMHHPSDAV